jgi:hypothetical protein
MPKNMTLQHGTPRHGAAGHIKSTHQTETQHLLTESQVPSTMLRGEPTLRQRRFGC